MDGRCEHQHIPLHQDLRASRYAWPIYARALCARVYRAQATNRRPKRKLKGSPIINTHEVVNLTYRGDYTPLCSYEVEVETRGEKEIKEIHLPLRVLPSELGKYPAQVFSCPMRRPASVPRRVRWKCDGTCVDGWTIRR